MFSVICDMHPCLLYEIYPVSLSLSKVEIHEAYFSALKTRVEELRPILLKISRREVVVQVQSDTKRCGVFDALFICPS